MIFPYALVFLGAFLFDVVPVPFPPAFTIMLFLQIHYDLAVWPVVVIGVFGSLAGRYVLTLYISKLSGKVFRASKKEDVEFLGKKLKQGGWKSQLVVLIYSFLPLPTTPIFVATGMANVPPLTVIAPFFVGKFTSDAAAVLLGKFGAEHAGSLTEDLTSWKSIVGLVGGLCLLAGLIFTDWRTLIQKKKFVLRFRVWK